jgi:hypothetical protein
LVSPFVSAERLVGGKRRKLSKLVTQSEKKATRRCKLKREKSEKIKVVKKQKGQSEIENENRDTEFCEKHSKK